MTDNNFKERLCLSKEDDIYVDHEKLMQHQMDALRFLYAQFKKKTAGVILNDPSGYGKTVVVVLFLQALRKLLPTPALVLCRAAELQHWRDHFHSWATTDDVIFESSNRNVKKPVFVNTRQHLAALARRTWSVAVVDDELPREPLQADFKIYLTNEDMKENLFKFSSIHSWFYPKEEFDIKLFTANANDLADVDRKSVMLDFFFEEIVFRSKNFTPFKKPETQTSIAIEPPRISRKNKDATGTKIKRSKTRVEEPDTNRAAKTPRTEPPERNATITSKDYYKDVEMDVESFIKNEKPITGESIEELMDFQTIRSDANEKEDASVVKDSVNGDVAVTVQVESENDVCTADYQNAINDIVNNENDRSIKSVSDGNELRVSADDGDTGKEGNIDSLQDVGSNENDKDKVDKSVCKNVESVLNENKAETIQDVVNKGSKKDLDTKLSELEEKTLNKFKGSLLDSIF